MRIRTRKVSFRRPTMQQRKVRKTPIKRVNEKRVYPLFKAPLNAGIDSNGNISIQWITFIPSTEAYVKKYFEDNAKPIELYKFGPMKGEMLECELSKRRPMVFVPCTYTIGDKEFIA